MARRFRTTSLPPPFLKRIWLPCDAMEDLPADDYPFSPPIAQHSALDLSFQKAIMIIVSENGSGKSPPLEAIATMAGFSGSGGAQGMAAIDRSFVSGLDAGRLGDR